MNYRLYSLLPHSTEQQKLQNNRGVTESLLLWLFGVYVWLKLAFYIILVGCEDWMQFVTKNGNIHKERNVLLELHMISFLSPLQQKKK